MYRCPSSLSWYTYKIGQVSGCRGNTNKLNLENTQSFSLFYSTHCKWYMQLSVTLTSWKKASSSPCIRSYVVTSWLHKWKAVYAFTCISMNYIPIHKLHPLHEIIFSASLPREFHLFQINPFFFFHCPIYLGTELPTHPSPGNFSPAKKWSGPGWCSSQPRCSTRHGWGTGRRNLARSECLSWAICSASDHTPWPGSRGKSLVRSGWRARHHRCQQWSEMASTTARPSTKPLRSEEDGQS